MKLHKSLSILEKMRFSSEEKGRHLKNAKNLYSKPVIRSASMEGEEGKEEEEKEAEKEKKERRKKTPKTIFLDAEDIDFIQEFSLQTGLSFSSIIRQALKEWIRKEKEKKGR